MQIGVYNFPNQVKGDSFQTVQFTLVVDAVAQDLTGWDIKIQFRKDCNLTKTLTLENGLIEITDALNGVFRLNTFIITMPVGLNLYDIQFTKPNGVVQTYIQGYINVLKEITV